MKSKKRVNLLMMVFACIMMTFALAYVRPVTAEAKTIKTKKVTAYKTPVSTARRQAKTVKKGTTTIIFKDGFVKFTAPKKKNYTFTFSGLSTPAPVDKQEAGIGFYKSDLKKERKVITPYGATKIVFVSSTAIGDEMQAELGTRYYVGTKSIESDVISATMKLKKGQTIYIRMTGSTTSLPYSLVLNIK